MLSYQIFFRRPVLLPALVVGLLLCPLLLGIEPLGGDADLMYRPIKQELARHLKEGRLPYWSDRFGLGIPLIAESHAAAFYPPNWLLYGALEPRAAYRLSLWLHCVALAITSYAYARTLGLSQPASILVSIGFSLCGFQAIHAIHEPFYTLMPYVPLCLLLGEKYLDSGRVVWLGLLALAWGVQVTIGHFQIQMWTAALVLAIGAWRVLLERRHVKRWLGLAASLVIGAGIACVQLQLTWEMTRIAGFSRPTRFLANYRFPLRHWAQWALPPLYLGRPARAGDPYWAALATTSEEAAAYVGIVVLVLACVGLLSMGRRSTLGAWCLISAATFGLATMPTWAPWGFELLMHVPGLGWFRAPARYTLLTSLGLILLAGHGLDRASKPGPFWGGLTLATALGLASAAWWLAGADDSLYRASLGPATMPFRIVAAALAWGAGVAAVVLWRQGFIGRWAPIAVLTVELCGLYYLGPVTWGNALDVGSSSPILKRLASEPGVNLVAGRLQNLPVLDGLAPAYPILGITAPPPNFLLESTVRPPGQAAAEDRHWQSRFGVSHGIWASTDDVSGTEILAEIDDPVLRRIFWDRNVIPPQARWRLVRYPNPAPSARIVANGGEVQTWEILYATLSGSNPPDEVLFIHGDHSPQTEASARLSPADFLNEHKNPRVVPVNLGLPAKKTRLRDWNGREAVVEHDGSCYLIVRRTHYRGWFYRVNDGPERPLLKANGGLQCVPLTGSGTSRITLVYRPTGLRRAATISLASTALALSLIIGSLAVSRRGNARATRPEPTPRENSRK